MSETTANLRQNGSFQHVWLSIANHGTEDGKVILSDKSGLFSDYDYIQGSSLKERVRELMSKGVIVHVHMDACYSGKFVEELTDPDFSAALGSERGQACVTASSNSGTPSQEGFAQSFLKADGGRWSQLSGMRSALALDQLNIPYSSLDFIVDEWERSKNRKQASASTESGGLVTSCPPEEALSAEKSRTEADIETASSLLDVDRMKQESATAMAVGISEDECFPTPRPVSAQSDWLSGDLMPKKPSDLNQCQNLEDLTAIRPQKTLDEATIFRSASGMPRKYRQG